MYPGLDLLGALVGALLITVVLTPVVGWVLLARYRRAVRRAMGATVDHPTGDRPETRPPESGALPPPADPAAPRLPAVLMTASDLRADPGGGAELRVIRHRLTVTMLAYGAAGLVYAAVAATVVLLAGDLAFLPRRTLALVVLHAWPVVPATLAVTAARRRTAAAAWLGFVGLLLVVTAGSGISVGELGLLLTITVAPPALLLAALSGRRLRAVGPFVAPAVFVLAFGLVAWPWGVVRLVDRGIGVDAAVVMVGAAVLAGAAATLGYLWWAAASYQRRHASDQMQTVSQWWALVTVWSSASLLPAGVRWSAALWLAYGAFRVVLRVALRAVPRQPSGRRLLLLRTFGVARRSESMLQRVSAGWRHVGSIQLVVGADLAAATLEPHEFLDFINGRLAERFIRAPHDLQRQLTLAEAGPDPDGRFRVTDLFCHDDTWRPVVQTLLDTTDVVVMDLRGFTAANRGVIHELGQVATLADLGSVVLVVDDTTDLALVERILTGAWQARGRPVSAPLRILRLDGDVTLEALLGPVCAAAASGERRTTFHHAPPPDRRRKAPA